VKLNFPALNLAVNQELELHRAELESDEGVNSISVRVFIRPNGEPAEVYFNKDTRRKLDSQKPKA